MQAVDQKQEDGGPFSGLEAFVKKHLVVVNAVVVASGSLVGALDFLAPKLSALPTLVYSATGALVVAMLAAALAPELADKALASMGFSSPNRSGPSTPLWRRPAWQFAVAILLGVTTLGFASVAKAAQGGIIAGALPEARRWQESLLSLKAESAEIKSGVESANAKLDRIVDAVDPDNPADRCPDIACAVQGGASAKAIKSLFDKGARIEGGPVNRGELMKWLAESSRPDRLQSLDLLVDHGLDPEIAFHAFATGQGEVGAELARVSAEIKKASRIGDRFQYGPGDPSASPELAAWNQVAGCLMRASKGTSMLELAALRGDLELYRHLKARGVSPPSRPLECRWSMAGQSGGARVDIGDDGVATVAPLRL